MFRPTYLIPGLLLLVLGLTAALKVSQQTWKDKVSIQSRASRAKSEGKTSITLRGPIAEYPGMGMSLDTALQKHSAVVAEVIETNTYIGDADVINTAYKFRIFEAITQNNAEVCDGCAPVRDISAKLHPASSNEFLIELSGGTLTVDGVKVHMLNTGGLEFEPGKKYLLFISFTPGGMARLAAGPVGVFRVRDDDILESVGSSDYPIPNEIAARHSMKLTRFRQSKGS